MSSPLKICGVKALSENGLVPTPQQDEEITRVLKYVLTHFKEIKPKDLEIRIHSEFNNGKYQIRYIELVYIVRKPFLEARRFASVDTRGRLSWTTDSGCVETYCVSHFIEPLEKSLGLTAYI